MRTVHLRSMSFVVVAVLTLSASAVAQERPSAVLNSVEIRQLVVRGEPADHARLGQHFTALGERYMAEAERHLSMPRSLVGNPSRNLGRGMNLHCTRLTARNSESATTVRELAAFHEKLATGQPATPPRGEFRYQEGPGAPKPTESELVALAAKASTPGEHRALQEYFLTVARQYTTAVAKHTAMARAYGGTRAAEAAAHHQRLARVSQDAAKEATAAADMHMTMAR